MHSFSDGLNYMSSFASPPYLFSTVLFIHAPIRFFILLPFLSVTLVLNCVWVTGWRLRRSPRHLQQPVQSTSARRYYPASDWRLDESDAAVWLRSLRRAFAHSCIHYPQSVRTGFFHALGPSIHLFARSFLNGCFIDWIHSFYAPSIYALMYWCHFLARALPVHSFFYVWSNSGHWFS